MTKTTGFTSLPDNLPLISDSALGFAQMRAAYDMSACPMLVLSLDKLEAISMNVAAKQFFGLADVESFCLIEFVLERDTEIVNELHKDLADGSKESGVVFVSAGDGIGIQRLSLRRVGSAIVAVSLAFKPSPSTAESLQDLDPLTGLMNRRVLEQRLERALTRKDKNWGVLFIDLNDYKQVNDLHGHIEGDRVLVEFAQKLAVSVRPGDLLVRFGGDEFVVFVERIPGLMELRFMADRIASEVSVEVDGGVPSVVVTASVGCAMASSSLSTGSALIGAADRDMYVAKRRKQTKAK